MTNKLLHHSNLLVATPNVSHGFTSRHGGASTGPLMSLNLGDLPSESEQVLAHNWMTAVGALQGEFCVEDLVLLDQVHGPKVSLATAPTGLNGIRKSADAVVTMTPGILLAVRVADCVPILLAGPGVVGAVHSGWRGTVQGVVERAVEAMLQLSGCLPEEIVASIGPHIGATAYRVGGEVTDGLLSAGLSSRTFHRRQDGLYADLGAAVIEQLNRVGVRRVDVDGRCTASDHNLFSFRKDGPETGRQAALIGLRC